MPGHVFLVHGDLTRLSCDAWLVPSSERPRPGHTWKDAVAAVPPPGSPSSWREVLPGRVLPWMPLQPAYPRPWLVLTLNFDVSPEQFADPAKQFLEAAYHGLPTYGQHNPRNARASPLFALPVVGAGYGGGADRAGEIVRALLPILYGFVQEHSADVALVMKDRAQYAAAQAARFSLKGEAAWPDLNPGQRAKCDELARRALRQELVVFLGAGVSQS